MRRQANNSQWTGSAVMPMASLCLLGVGLCWNAVAQETIYRCGQEYTNAPKDMALCQPLAEQNIVVIPGLRPQAGNGLGNPAQGAGTNDGRTKTEPTRPMAALQGERDVQARAILAQELERIQKQHLELLQEYKLAELAKSQAETQNQSKSLERVVQLKAAIARAERDMDSLQRELSRYPLTAKGATP